MLLETHPMPPLSAAAIEAYVEQYLAVYIPQHLTEPRRLMMEDMENMEEHH